MEKEPVTETEVAQEATPAEKSKQVEEVKQEPGEWDTLKFTKSEEDWKDKALANWKKDIKQTIGKLNSKLIDEIRVDIKPVPVTKKTMEAFFHIFEYKDAKGKKQAWKDFKDKKIDLIKLLRAFKIADLSFEDCKNVQEILEGVEQDKVDLAAGAIIHIHSWIVNNVQLRIAASKNSEILNEVVVIPTKVLTKKVKASEEKKEPKQRPKTAVNGGLKPKKLDDKKEEEKDKKPIKRPVKVIKPIKNVPKEQDNTEENKEKVHETKPKINKVDKISKPVKELKSAKEPKQLKEPKPVKEPKTVKEPKAPKPLKEITKTEEAKAPKNISKIPKKEIKKPTPAKKNEEEKEKQKQRPQTAKVEVKSKIKADNKIKDKKLEEKKVPKPNGNKKSEDKNINTKDSVIQNSVIQNSVKEEQKETTEDKNLDPPQEQKVDELKVVNDAPSEVQATEQTEKSHPAEEEKEAVKELGHQDIVTTNTENNSHSEASTMKTEDHKSQSQSEEPQPISA